MLAESFYHMDTGSFYVNDLFIMTLTFCKKFIIIAQNHFLEVFCMSKDKKVNVWIDDKKNTYGFFGYWYFYYVPALLMHKTLE